MTKSVIAMPLAVAILVAGCSSEPASDSTSEASNAEAGATEGDTAEVASDASLSIAENMAANPALSTMAEAVTAAGLTETLGGAGPYTVFAPTNEAFGAVAGGEELLANGGPELVSIVSYHIVPGVVMAEDLRNAATAAGGSTQLATMTGALLTVNATDDGVSIADGAGNTALITSADNTQANGMIHVIDAVLMPG